MMTFIKYGTLLFVLFLGIQSLKGQNAEELLETMDSLIAAPKDKEASVKMIMTNKSEKQKIREAKMLQKGMYKRLYRYTKPEDKQAQKWYTGILKGQDNVINEVNNILNNG